jgi:hypothetical protein
MWRVIVVASRNNSRYMFALAAVLVLAVPIGGAEALHSGIQVELDSQKPLSLRVTLTSHAETQVTFPKYRLPWGNRNSMILVAVTPGKDYIVRNFPIDDPSYERVSVEPNESLSGDVSLEKAFTGLEAALKKSEIHLFWAYRAPEELHIARWSGGWILIPRQK